MNVTHLLAVAILCLSASLLYAEDQKDDRNKSPAQASFERIKQLEGDWLFSDGDDKGEIGVSYALTAAGTAVVEKIFPGTPHEMTTVYHLDGDRLMMTHYCAVGNQPRMRATPAEGDRISFTCIGVSNVKSEDDGHMHAMTMIFVDPDHLTHEWTWHQGGQGGPKPFHFERKK